MFSWLQKDVPVAASILFRGAWPCTKEGFLHMREKGIEITDGDRSEAVIWSLELEHLEWGEATLICMRNFPMPPEILVDWDSNLLDSEKTEVKACGTAVSLMVRSRRKHLLRDRKNALCFMDAVMGEEGIAALDHVSQKFWSRAELKAEVAHAADVDVQSLYTAHFVTTGAEPNERTWYHTHGLAELGLLDFDILDPSNEALTTHGDSVRAVAFAIVEGRLKAGGVGEIFSQHPFVAMAAGDFMAKAAPEWTGIRDDPAGDHLKNRVVLCDPPPTGLLARFRAQARPYSFLMRDLPDDALMHFSNGASALMAERALATYPLFRSIFEELKEYDPPALVKLGYRTDNGSETNREHLWFRVHEARDGEIDATLLNAPFGISRMKEGDRATHPIENISDWQFMTPAGPINPRQGKALRLLREFIAQSKSEGKALEGPGFGK